MTNDPDTDWTDLQGVWQAQQASEGVMLREIRRRALRARIVFYGEAAISLGGLAVSVLLAARQAWAPALTVGLYSAFGLGLSYATRSRLWKVESGDVASALERLTHQARSGLRVARAGFYMCAAALLLLAVFAVHGALGALTQDQSDRLLTVLGVALTALAVVIVTSALQVERARARVERLLAVRESLRDDASG
jgi:hypothetical protein